MAETPKKPATNARKKPGDKKPYRRRRASQLAAVTGGLLAPSLRRKGFMQQEVVAKWGEIVGPELAAATVPIGLRFPRGKRLDGKLSVRCTSAFAPLLQHRLPHVLDAVNRYFGYGAVADIHIVQGPLPKPRAPRRRPPPDALSPEREAALAKLIPDSKKAAAPDQQALCDSLRKLGRSVIVAHTGDKQGRSKGS